MRRPVTACIVGVAASAAIGSLAAVMHGGDPWTVFAAFTVATIGPCICAALFLLVWRRTVPTAPADQPDSVERIWWLRVSSGAFVDLACLLGAALFLVALTDVGAMDPTWLLAGVLAIAWVDLGVRAAVLRRAES